MTAGVTVGVLIVPSQRPTRKSIGRGATGVGGREVEVGGISVYAGRLAAS